MPPPTEPVKPSTPAVRPLLHERFAAIGPLFVRTLSTLESMWSIELAELVLFDHGQEVRVFTRAIGSQSGYVESVGTRRDYSDSLWPSEIKSLHRVDDAADQLDTSRSADLRFVATGARFVVVAPLRAEGETLGVLVVASRIGTASELARTPFFGPTCEFLGLAAERERHWAIERVRQERRARLEATLPAIAGSLDVRKVFVEMSGVIQGVIAHDVLAFALLLPDRTGVRVQAATERGVLELPEYKFSNSEEALDANWQFLLAYDLVPVDSSSVRARISPRSQSEVVEVVTRPGPEWMKFIVQARIRSILRVPIRSQDRPIGGVVFMSRQGDAYDSEDGLVASRLSDQLALALAHEELAAEERRIAQAEERARTLEVRVDLLSRELERFSAHRAIGQSRAWKRALADAAQVAVTDATVLITGESGTGKEVIARYIHRGSLRAKAPFVALNCAALPENLMESELFGHERGAFTGAIEARAGRIEQAAGGVLFLDEVGEMTPPVQAKFLRVLQEREFQRVGGSKVIQANVRIVAATNRDPRAGIAAGTFREDLYYRLNVFEIHLPPLRERPDDILVLASAFLEEVGRTIGRPSAGLSESAREQLLSHTWPGNVRELRNAIERAVILCGGGLVTREHLPMSVARAQGQAIERVARGATEFPDEGLPLSAVEKDMLVKALAKADNNKSQAAKLLGLSRGQLYSLLRRHGLTRARR